jgi:hypothetical protein
MTRTIQSCFRAGLLVAVGLALAGAAAAQTAVCAPSEAKVKRVYREEVETVEIPGKLPVQVLRKYRTAKLRDTITVEVTGLASLAACTGKSIVLFLDDRPLTDVVAFPPTDPAQQLLRFPLERTEASREVWTHLLGRPELDPRRVEVSIGLADQYAIAAEAPGEATILLDVIPVGWFLFWLLLFIVFLLGFCYLARRTDVIRDAVPLPGEGARRPYSLARTQAAWWFFLVLASYMLIGMITGDFSTTITATVLILMGISAGTVVGSAFVDASKPGPTAGAQAALAQSIETDVLQLSAEMQQAQAALRQAPGDVATAQALAAMVAEHADKLSKLKKVRNESEHFLQDILSDVSGVSFHRFQMLAWTVVLGIIFIGQVYKELAMPEFSETLLSLMGISAGTYIGLKIPEDTRG